MGGSGSSKLTQPPLRVGRILPIADGAWDHVTVVAADDCGWDDHAVLRRWWAPEELCGLWWAMVVTIPGDAIWLMEDARTGQTMLSLCPVPLSELVSRLLGLRLGVPRVPQPVIHTQVVSSWWCPVTWSPTWVTVDRPRPGEGCTLCTLARWQRGGLPWEHHDIALCVVWDPATQTRRLCLQQSSTHPAQNIWSPQQPQATRRVHPVDLVWYLLGIPGRGTCVFTPWDATDPG